MHRRLFQVPVRYRESWLSESESGDGEKIVNIRGRSLDSQKDVEYERHGVVRDHIIDGYKLGWLF